MTLFYALLLGILIVGIGLGVLLLLNRVLKWKMKFLTTDSGFLQTWVSIIQTIILVATLGYIGYQTASVEKSVRVNTVQLMVSGHRELLGKILDQPKLFEALTAKDIPTDPASVVFLSMFLNHGFNAFTLREHGYIDDDWWAAMILDMQDIIRREAMRKWWGRVKQFYPTRYQRFIDHSILKSKKGG